MPRFLSVVLLLSLSLVLGAATGVLPDPVQTYFVPLPENDLFKLFWDISSTRPAGAQAAGNVVSITSLAIAADNTIIYYDHWEDGYENCAKLRTQATTEICGDGDLTNCIERRQGDCPRKHCPSF